jgi:hypothetical protein
MLERLLRAGAPQLEEIGSMLVAEVAPLLKGAVTAVDKEAAALQFLGPLEIFATKYNGLEVALFGNNKVVVRRELGQLSVLDSKPLSSNWDGQVSWRIFDGDSHGKSLVESVEQLEIWPRLGSLTLQQPPVGILLSHSTTADEAFFAKAIPPGSLPIGHGGSRMAFLTPDKDVSVIGLQQFRQPLPDMVFPKSRLLGGNIQAERLPFVGHEGLTDEHVVEVGESVRKFGFMFNDRQVANIGRLDNKLKVVDPGSVNRGGISWTDPYAHHRTAAENYRKAIVEATAEFGANSHPVAGFQSEFGLHLMNKHDMQSAEENLRTGLIGLVAHGDWSMVETTAERLRLLYDKTNDASMAREYMEHKLAAAQMHQNFKSTASWR